MNKTQKAIKQIEEEALDAERLLIDYKAGKMTMEEFAGHLEIYAQIERLAKITLNIIIIEKKTKLKIGLWV
jgi:hypothetical protein